MGHVKTWAVVIGVLGLVACGEDTQPSSNILAPVVIRTDPASPADCPNGGSVVLAGPDRNGNAVLDDDEVEQRVLQCTTSAVPTVLRLVAEPPGANCADGGTAVQSGPDTNANGQLDGDEVAHVDYVCGDRLLTRIASEPAGAHCAAGGVAFLAGPDRDHDGVLSDAEVAHTEYACGDVLSRDVTIHSSADAEALANIAMIDGSLTIGPEVVAPDGEITLPALRYITYNLLADRNPALVAVHLPQLRATGNYVSFVDESSLTTIDMPRLSDIGGSLDIGNATALTSLDGLADGYKVRGSLTLRNNPALASAKLVESWGDLTIVDNPKLVSLFVFLAAHIDQAVIKRNGLTTFQISGPGILQPSIGFLQVSDNPALDKVDIAVDALANVEVTGNPGLTQVSLATYTLDQLRVMNDPLLTTLAIDIVGGKVGDLYIDAPVGNFGSGLDIAGSLTLEGTHVTSVRLKQVRGTLRLAHNLDLVNDIFITDVLGGLEVVENPVMTALDLGNRLSTINGNVLIRGNPKLVNTEALLYIHTVTGNVTIEDNPELLITDAAMSTVLGSIEVINNAKLNLLGFGLLRTTIAMTVRDNPVLPTCQAQAVFAQIPDANRQQSGNNDAGTCP